MKKLLASLAVAGTVAAAGIPAQAQGLGGGFNLDDGVGTQLAVAGGLIAIGAIAVANGKSDSTSTTTTN